MNNFIFQIDDERQYEVEPFTLDARRQVEVHVQFCFLSRNTWHPVHVARLCGVLGAGFWFPATVTEQQFPEVLRKDALRAVEAAFPDLDNSPPG